MQLVDMHCRPCKGEHERPLSEKDALGLLKGLPGWKMMDGRLVMRYEFGSFTEAVSFLNRMAAIASEEQHTPDVCIEGFNNMRLSLYTYCCGGLTENDFILAAKIGRAYEDFEKAGH